MKDKLFSAGTLKDPGALLGELWARVPHYIRVTFCSALVMGFVTHMYMFTNKFTNHDDLNQMFYADYGTASGRWLLPPILRLDGNFSIPWLIGVLSVLCMAGIACFTVALLRIRRPLGCVLTSALIVTFPASTATFGYMFSADAYFFSMMLAAAGAYAAVRWGWRGSALGVIALTLSMGIYQSYLPVAAVLMVGALLLEALDGERSFKELFLHGLRLAGTLAVALIAYMIIVKLTTRNTGLTDYEGISDMGKLSLPELPKLIWAAYRKYFYFFLKNDWNCHFGFLKYAFLLTGLCSAVLGALVLVRRKLGAARTVLALALAAVYPLAGALIYVMVPNGYVHIHMLYGLVYILIAPITLAEYAAPLLTEGNGRLFHAAASWVLLLTLALTGYSYAVTDNNAYLKADMAMRQCEAYSNRLLERVESCEGYQPEMAVVLVGSTIREAGLDPTPELDSARLVGIFNLGDLRTYFTYRHFLRYYTGFTGPVFTGDSETATTLAATEEVQAMPCYPRDGSVRIIDGKVVVKLNG